MTDTMLFIVLCVMWLLSNLTYAWMLQSERVEHRKTLDRWRESIGLLATESDGQDAMADGEHLWVGENGEVRRVQIHDGRATVEDVEGAMPDGHA